MDTQELGLALLKVCRTHRKLSFSKFRESGISHGQPPILKYLHDNNGCIQSELSKVCHLEPATITSNLTIMERDGLVERRPNPSDRRVWQIFLTQKGGEAYEALMKTEECIIEECFVGFSEDEREAAAEMLNRLYHNMVHALEESPNHHHCDSQGGNTKTC